ncbi:DUF1415 domain-containing protein [Oceanobacter mangrovi]|uniref:DUF1415 domain-containing protein n=1 Tax=Oceanobacter mangrovi TaxID=2862510 RepID=UPI001C8E7511|nr:DUF1415 domain-containing protein [Oceanobacter mangrovi]
MSPAELTRLWVTRLVVGEGLCPFAHPVMSSLAIHVCDSDSLNQATAELMQLLTDVHEADPQQLPTALFVTPKLLQSFDEYWNWYLICDELLAQMGYEGELQLASFHPHYCFEGEAADDPSNFSNRSPFPMLHIIREADIEQALESVANPEKIPERNQRHLRRLGLQGILAIMPELADTQVFQQSESSN